MIADTIDEQELKSGKRMEGVFYGGLTFSYKLSQAFAIFILGFLLDFVRLSCTTRVYSHNIRH